MQDLKKDELRDLVNSEGEDNFALMFEQSEKKNNSGSIKDGVIVAINDEYAMVDIGSKSEGKLPVDEIKDENGELLFKKGDSIQVYTNNRGVVSYKKMLKHKITQDEINKLKESDNYKDKIIEATVIGKNKGGYILEKDGVEYFMPKFASALKDDGTKKDAHIGKSFKVCIIEIRDDSIIVSRKRYFEVSSKRQHDGSISLVQSGEAYEGVVKNITNFGMFVDIDGIEGLVHYTEISHKGPVNPSKLYKEGDKIKVKPIKYDEEKKRLSLSIKALFEDPWQEIQNEIKVGYVIKVVVSNIETYGAFVDLGNDLEGFLHISEISWDKSIKYPGDYLKVGEEIDVEVIEIDSANRRLRVSLKKQQDKPFTKFVENHKVGDIIKGKIATFTPFGIFLNLGGIDGLLHNEDAFWDKSKKAQEIYKIGDELEVKLIKIDKTNEKVSLSLKALDESPVEKFSKKYNVDDPITGTVINIQDFGVFIKIKDENVDALIRNDDLAPLKKEEIKVGDEITGVLAHVDTEANRIRVSVRRLQKQKERQELSEYSSGNERMNSLGDLLKGKLQ
ncbi:30S ribosomal protein S1 [Helicobacter sp. 13S00401-1]|uniref:30S ribosomal protein S1 n=1 Tax=Helicobacter sp. 13S00401-1 TaxID=1905758 RepID=UPI000BA5EF5B|nr:30S ribosomal protein S1 [Helicobacter sp. 13S00401-1]PAF51102.1 30S ribosomal protein S1 [Helicobacter sp. 13S00401-1]